MAIGLVGLAEETSRDRAELSLANAEFRYEPYPVGFARNVFAESTYAELLDSWPATGLFQNKPDLGKKYSLSEVNNAAAYHAFLKSSTAWRRFYEWIKGPEFVGMVLASLASRRIDLGLHTTPVCTTHAFSGRLKRFRSAVRRRVRQWIGHAGVLRSRFEFSMLPADGGHIKPHTDHFTKLVTLVISMVRSGEWNPAWGGATAIERPKDITANFNHMNRQMEFADMETLDGYAFEPNQCVLFVKTFNSHHSVHPMTGRGSGAMRRTLTVNIERVVA
jgi:hypothetical protein